MLWPTCASRLPAQLDYEREPIVYSKSVPENRISKLQAKIDSGQVNLKWEAGFGYLRSFLAELDVNVDSQVMVFSKTSLQATKISPKTPRAIYFCDDLYVGWVPQGELIEISAVDDRLGAVFYALKQKQQELELTREIGHCVTCHASTHTRRVPGHIVRSVFCDETGQPMLNLGSFVTTDQSPLEQRWGGWYVTGTHGKQRHLGNQIARDNPGQPIDIEAGANATDLSSRFDTSRYLSPHSDLVALMILEHQTVVQNAITAASHQGRIAELEFKSLSELLDNKEEYSQNSFAKRFDQAASAVVRVLLMKDAIELSDTISGTSEFAERFQTLGPFDSQGRSLRQLDLKRRLLRYPCSYLIYSPSLKALPAPVLDRVYLQLGQILSATTTSGEYKHLSLEDRRAIREILLDTGVPIATISEPTK